MATTTDLSKEIGDILQTFNHSVETATDKAAVEAGKLAVKELKGKTRGVHTWKVYPKGWTIKKMKNGTVYVWNAKSYRLTHLLEKGHKTNYKTGRYGSHTKTRAFPHIAPVELMVQQQFPQLIDKNIQLQK